MEHRVYLRLYSKWIMIFILTSLFTNGRTADGKWENNRYYCRFSQRVDCLWQINGSTVSISNYNYSYINGNGKNTNYCSIEKGKNGNPLPDTIRCLGIKQGLFVEPDYLSENRKQELKPTYNFSESRHLYNCQYNTTVDTCTWMINGTEILINTYYYYSTFFWNYRQYISECSIRGGKEAKPLPDSLTCIGYSNNIIVTAVINQTIEIPCRLYFIWNCTWKRNNEVIDIKNRFEYSGAKRGIDTTDCSIKIKQFQKIDQGEWICLGLNLYLGNYRLRITNALNVIPEALIWKPHHAYSCNFDFEVDCQWMINGITMSMASSDYNYIIGNGKNTSDCSIRGQENANPLPDTIQCFGIKDEQSIESSYIKEELKLETKPTYELRESRHQYHCNISTMVESCTWQANETTIPMINQLYHYKNNLYIYESCNAGQTNGSFCNMMGEKEANKLPDDVKCVGIRERVLITAAINETIVLNCTSKESVGCIWKKNNESIYKSQRFEYIGGVEEIKSSDCSIKLKQAKEIDQGEWTCFRKGDCFGSQLPRINIYLLKVRKTSMPLQTNLNVSSTYSTVETNLLTNISITNEVNNNVLLGCLFAALIIIILLCIYIIWGRKRLNCGSCQDKITTDNPNGRQNSPNTSDNHPMITHNASSNETSDGYLIPISINQNYNLPEIHYEEISFGFTKNTLAKANANVHYATVSTEPRPSSSTTDPDGNSLPITKDNKLTDTDNENVEENANLYEQLKFLR
ncbi:hypothetical protein CHUAL_007662 [Chamberlinius hualienensis]